MKVGREWLIVDESVKSQNQTVLEKVQIQGVQILQS